MSATNQARVAKLEALLARVSARVGAARDADSAVTAPRHVVAIPPRTAAAKPASPAVPPPTARIPAATIPDARAADDLPDLEFVESTAPSGERRPSLRPSTPAAATPPVGEADDSGEFDIPAHPSARPSRGPKPEPIDLGPVGRASEIEIDGEIDRTPLAGAVPQPPRDATFVELRPGGAVAQAARNAAEVMGNVASAAATAAAGVAVGVVAGIAAGVAAVTGSTRHSNRPPPDEAIESVALPPAPPIVAEPDEPFDDARVTDRPPTSLVVPPVVVPPASSAVLDASARLSEPGPERFAPARSLPSADAVEFVGTATPPRPATFRALLERSIALRPRR